MNKDMKQTLETEVGTIRECETRCSITLLQTVIEGSVVGFPQFKDETKNVSRQLQYRNIYEPNTTHTTVHHHIPKQQKQLNNKLANNDNVGDSLTKSLTSHYQYCTCHHLLIVSTVLMKCKGLNSSWMTSSYVIFDLPLDLLKSKGKRFHNFLIII